MKLLVLSLLLGTAVCAQAPFPADFGDAPDPGYPSLFMTGSSRIGMPGPYHLDVSQEWMGPPPVSTTTLESDALPPDADQDDGFLRIGRTLTQMGLTQWGFAIVDLATAGGIPECMRYLNVAVDFNRDGQWASYLYDGVNEQREWMIRNAAVWMPAAYSGTIAFSFYFPDLGADAGPPMWGRATLSTDYISPALYGVSGWDGSGQVGGFVRGETEDWLVNVHIEDVTGGTHGIGGGLDRGAATPGDAVPGGAVVSATAEGYLRGGVPDINQGTNECAPTSATNSVQWLGGQQGFTVPNAATTLGELKKDMRPGYVSGEYPGIAPDNFLTGKNAFTQRHGLPIASRRGGAFDGTGTFDFLKQQLKSGADCEMRIQYPGDGGGHWVTAVGYSVSADGTQRIYVNDPLSPGPRTDSYEVLPDGTIKDYPYGAGAKVSFAVAETRVIWGESSNFDVMNYTGLAANDFEVTLGGVKPGDVKGTYTGALGYPGQTTSATAGGTTVKWSGATTAPGAKSHFGYSLGTGVTPTSVGMTWTKDGVTIGSLPTSPQTFKVNDGGAVEAVVTNAGTGELFVQRSFAVLPQIVPLDELNRDNPLLHSLLVQIDPVRIPLMPGQSLSFEFPKLPAEIPAVVFAYGVSPDPAAAEFDVFYYNEALVYIPRAFSSIGSLKNVPDGTAVTIDTPVVALDGVPDSFFDVYWDNVFAAEDRSSGIAALGAHGIQKGSRALLTGRMSSVSGMRVLEVDDALVVSDGQPPAPLAMTQRALGNAALAGFAGIDSTALPVRAVGRVKGIRPIPPHYAFGASEAYVLDDGSFTPTAVPVRVPDPALMEAFVVVTGVSAVWAMEPLMLPERMIVPSQDADIVPLAEH